MKQRCLQWIYLVTGAVFFFVAAVLPTVASAQENDQDGTTSTTVDRDPNLEPTTTAQAQADIQVSVVSEAATARIETTTRQRYRLSIANLGSADLPARALTLALKVPSGDSGQVVSIEIDRFQTGSGALTPSGDSMWCGRGMTTQLSCTNRQSLAAGQSITVDIRYRHPTAEQGTFRLEAKATSTVADPNLGNNEIVGTSYQFATVPATTTTTAETTTTEATTTTSESTTTTAEATTTTTEATTTTAEATTTTVESTTTTAEPTTTILPSSIEPPTTASTVTSVSTAQLDGDAEDDAISPNKLTLPGNSDVELEGKDADSSGVPIWLYGIGGVIALSIVGVVGMALFRSILTAAPPLVDLRERHYNDDPYLDEPGQVEEYEYSGYRR